MQCLLGIYEGRNTLLPFMMHKCCNNVRKKETAQCSNYHMLEHTHVPIHPCWVIVWSRFGAISEVGGGGEDVGARGVRLYLRRGVVGVQLDFT